MWLGCEAVKVNVCLGSTIIVGVACGSIVTAHTPFMLVSPFDCIVVIAVVWIDRVECHKPFEVYATSPDICLINFFTRIIWDTLIWIRVFAHIMVIYLDKGFQSLLTRRKLLGGTENRNSHDGCKSKKCEFLHGEIY